jgi:hypothetical protein
MNVGRGLFRLWLVMAAIWVCLIWLLFRDAKWAFPEARRPAATSAKAGGRTAGRSGGVGTVGYFRSGQPDRGTAAPLQSATGRWLGNALVLGS